MSSKLKSIMDDWYKVESDDVSFYTDIKPTLTSAPNDFSDEPPLLEELGIDFDHIFSKSMFIIVPTRSIDTAYLEDTDLAGPVSIIQVNV